MEAEKSKPAEINRSDYNLILMHDCRQSGDSQVGANDDTATFMSLAHFPQLVRTLRGFRPNHPHLVQYILRRSGASSSSLMRRRSFLLILVRSGVSSREFRCTSES